MTSLPPTYFYSFAYEYQVRDHLGNPRLTFRDSDHNGYVAYDDSEVIQTQSYYPFGMDLDGYPSKDTTAPAQAYRYNRKEALLGG